MAHYVARFSPAGCRWLRRFCRNRGPSPVRPRSGRTVGTTGGVGGLSPAEDGRKPGRRAADDVAVGLRVRPTRVTGTNKSAKGAEVVRIPGLPRMDRAVRRSAYASALRR